MIIPKQEEHPGEIYQFGNLSWYDFRDENNESVSPREFKYLNELKQTTVDFFNSEYGQNELLKRLEQYPAWAIELLRKNSDPVVDGVYNPSRFIPLNMELVNKLKAATHNPMYGSRLKAWLDDVMANGG